MAGRKNDDSIYKLLNELEMQEKRYINLYLTQFTGKKTNYFIIYEFIVKNKINSDGEFFENFDNKKTSIVTDYPVLKKNLVNIILNALQNYYTSSTLLFEVTNALIKIQILIRKGLFTLALSSIKHYKQLCLDNELYIRHSELSELECDVYFKIKNADKIEAVHLNYANSVKKSFKKIKEISNLKKTLQLNIINLTIYRRKIPVDIVKVMNAYTLSIDKSNIKDSTTLYYYHFCIATYQLYINEPEKSIGNLIIVLKLLKERHIIIPNFDIQNLVWCTLVCLNNTTSNNELNYLISEIKWTEYKNDNSIIAFNLMTKLNTIKSSSKIDNTFKQTESEVLNFLKTMPTYNDLYFLLKLKLFELTFHNYSVKQTTYFYNEIINESNFTYGIEAQIICRLLKIHSFIKAKKDITVIKKEIDSAKKLFIDHEVNDDFNIDFLKSSEKILDKKLYKHKTEKEINDYFTKIINANKTSSNYNFYYGSILNLSKIIV